MKFVGHYCGLFKGRKHLILLLLPKYERIQPKNAHKPLNFRGFFIAISTYSTEKLRILLRLYFGISEIDCNDYRGDRIRTCDLVLPKHPRYQAAPRPAHKILVHNMHLLKSKFKKYCKKQFFKENSLILAKLSLKDFLE